MTENTFVHNVHRRKRNWTRIAIFVSFQTFTRTALINVHVNEMSKFRSKTATLIFAAKWGKKMSSRNVKCILGSFYDFASLRRRKK